MNYNKFRDNIKILIEKETVTYVILFLLMVTALIFGLMNTQLGVNITPDSVGYINVGESLFHGNGFYITSYGAHQAYTVQPPLYPVMISILMNFRISAEQSARLIPILSFALLMIPLFFIGRKVGNQYTGLLACIMCLTLTPLLEITAHAWTEMPYILFTAFSILFLTKFILESKSKNQILCLAAIFSSLAILTRYIGITLIIVGIITLLIQYRFKIKQMIFKLLIFGSISCIPISIWFYRNLMLTSSISGGNRSGVKDSFIINALTIKTTIMYDFGLIFVTLATIFIVLMACYLFIKKNSYKKYLKNNYVIILYIFIYTGTLLLIKTLWAFDPIDYRLLAPIYPFLMVATISLFYCTFNEVKRYRSTLVIALAVILGLFFMYQINSLNWYINTDNGIDNYNSIEWKDYNGLKWIQNNVPINITIYSNIPEGTSFRLKRPVKYIPTSKEEFINQLNKDNSSIIICFKDNHPPYLSNKELKEISKESNLLKVVANFPEATIYKTK